MDAHEARLYFQLQRTAAQLKKKADSLMLDKAGITAAQAALLTIVDSRGPIRQRLIADSLELKESAVTQMVAKLEDRGLVVRQQPDDDQRAREVAITAAGRRAIGKARGAFAPINAALDEVTDGEAEKLAGELTAICDALARLS